ncbi:hypothetical protein LOTGIDRAFT_239211 [Lottia gigantea]|uniref:Uncharacterized protein n=1 Tax=Lottia gigantea TaxID=225164 RepID=V4ATJ9_LOTGI|nr:hypothetical protein LOTGIDRAFT_239211 [Lottia gigantea]ESO97071.1 hypothetical protein LOTGIDRAFT_239211 [Lottia gigantea]
MSLTDTRISIHRLRGHDSRRSLSTTDETAMAPVVLRRKRSLAQSFSQRVVTEQPFLDPRESKTSWGPSVGQSLSLEYRDSQITVREGDEIDGATSKWKLNNVRAKLGTVRLLLFDFKTWYRRWRYKSWDNPFLYQYISHIERNFGSGIGALFFFTRWVIMLNTFLVVIWLLFVVIPMAINFDYSSIDRPFVYRNLLDGQGPVADSWVFFCSYKPKILANGIIFPNFYYHIGLAYLSMILFTFFGSLFILLRNMAIARKPSVSNSLNKRYRFSFLLFSSWDFSITAEDAAINLRKGIISALKTLLGLKYVVAAIDSDLVQPVCRSVIEDANLLQVYMTPVAFSLINLFIPFFLSKIPLIEKYKTGQAELNITISRIFFLRMANVFALIMSLYSMTLQSERLAVSRVCIGTILGQEIYKLIIMDTIIHIGTLVCPVLPLVGAVSNLIFFFLNYAIVTHTCKPPIKRWRQTRRTFFFMSVLLFTLFCVIVPVSIVIGSRVIDLGATSTANVVEGPFSGQFIPTSVYTSFANSLPIYWLKLVLLWLISNTVVLPLFLILVSVLSYQKMRLTGEKTHCLILQAELQQEREDNKKLVKKLQEVRLYGNMALKL